MLCGNKFVVKRFNNIRCILAAEHHTAKQHCKTDGAKHSVCHHAEINK